MAVNTTLAGLSQAAASNGPDGAVDPPSNLDDSIRYALAFIAQLRDGVGFASGLTIPSKALTTPVSITFSATPTIDASLSNVFYVGALTANITSTTISNPSDGQTINVRFVQDATGSRTVALPASVHVNGSPQSGASLASWLVITYVSSASRWEGSWVSIP